MIFLPLIILALIQGVTEFLPISSSGHLVLVHHFFDDMATMTAIEQKRLDIAVHIGTLLAVIGYFYRDFFDLFMGGRDILKFNFKSENAHKAKLIAISSIPVILCGSVLFVMDMTIFDSLHIIAWTTLVFGVVLYIADKRPQNDKTIQDFTIKHALIYGLFQCIALIPGVSRSGITMTAGRFMNHSRTESARYSLLMGMVTIAAAGVLTGVSVFKDSDVTNAFLTQMAIGIVLSFVAAYATLTVMMRWFKNNGSMTPFALYRVVLGLGLLGLIYSGFIA